MTLFIFTLLSLLGAVINLSVVSGALVALLEWDSEITRILFNSGAITITLLFIIGVFPATTKGLPQLENRTMLTRCLTVLIPSLIYAIGLITYFMILSAYDFEQYNTSEEIDAPSVALCMAYTFACIILKESTGKLLRTIELRTCNKSEPVEHPA